ncbi:MAG: hypothetical protein ACR5K7_01755 [Symbiopectobacterium sp.]
MRANLDRNQLSVAVGVMNIASSRKLEIDIAALQNRLGGKACGFILRGDFILRVGRVEYYELVG